MLESARAIAKRAEKIIPLLLGVASFWTVTGGRILNGRNIAWMQDGDPAQYFLGWHFFRTTPWGFPLGASPRFGMEIGSGIAYADNVPLFALPFKVIARWLPMPFQYHGIWILLCFVLQAWFAWLLLGLATRLVLQRAAGSLLFVFAPVVLYRLGGHYTLFGQWTILAALYLCLGPRHLARGPAWPLLAFAVGLMHWYLTVMVCTLWLTDWLRRVLFDGRRVADFIQLFAVPALLLLDFWQAGLFIPGHVLLQSGFGEYKMNVLSLLDPSGWSYLMKDIPGSELEYEGFNFFGLGSLLLALLAIPALKRAWPWLRSKREYWPLLLLCVGLTLFAISNRVGFAAHSFEIPLPTAVIDRANMLRGSGRMFWPVYYLLLFVCVRTLFQRHSARSASLFLLGALAVQIADTSAGWLVNRRAMMHAGPAWSSPLQAPFWTEVPSVYQSLRLVPTRSMHPQYADLAYFAGMHEMSTDAVYLARIDTAKRDAGTKRGIAALRTGKYESGVLYIVDRGYRKWAQHGARPKRDLVRWIDGFLVVAPNWKCRPQCFGENAANEPDCSSTCDEHTPKP